ncbi:MAG: DNA topoisomerase IB [Candidatus Andeanibacterium colombiense]|uniref:DNA topoisomerase n=1 Tax=Candidatus Andeanibacterium colombiense TaxID=3121345 RepID=A0AAJ5XBK3_9SPHN|nr:MAG: DNA topoisomerase IB [Sphingomonadaceae bacterium]
MHYANTDTPAITRRKLRGHWAYYTPDGERITSREEIDRLNSIGLPPAYTNAWFAADADSHILAIGYDARGRKQYRYNPAFTARRDNRKFGGCAAFGHDLPKIRARVEKDLGKRGLTPERAVASVVRLLDSGRIRIGNESYTKANGSFGATTLRRKHARLTGNRLCLQFKAKSGKQCTLTVTDRRLIRFVRQVQELPGQNLFQYQGEDGDFHPIHSSDVNAYIHETMGEGYTAKDFRTWRASVLAFEYLMEQEEGPRLKGMLAHVSEHLGNTPAIARKSYVHPALVELARTGNGRKLPARLPRATRWLTSGERGFLAFIDRKSSRSK